MGIFKVVIKSAYILKACKDAIQSWPRIFWNSHPLELDPEVFLTYLDEFKEDHDHLASKKPQTQLDSYVLSSVDLLLSSINSNYQNTIHTIIKLKSHGKITWDLLFAFARPEHNLLFDGLTSGKDCSQASVARVWAGCHSQV
ncbi:uncharacterized protein ARMOST_00015 [Armillaria ostoyae]|uniref:Uncharacterized protein n=1 Tax=Armillaria ostoyae TaxID=47428 RepID=A0A284QJY8_ARMOS|nr:uncharacterized protein ARMOST_00015 [Armillaria ostoyae]